MNSISGIAGLDALRGTLESLRDKSAKKIAKAGINAGLAALAKEIKNGVDASSMSPEAKQAVRQTVAKRLKKKEGQEFSGKAGFGVGKKSESKTLAAHQRAGQGHGGAQARGVGISSANVHWLLGTEKRTETPHAVPFPGETNADRKGVKYRPVAETGQMPDLVGGIIAQAAANAGDAVLAAAQKRMSVVLASEAATMKKG